MLCDTCGMAFKPSLVPTGEANCRGCGTALHYQADDFFLWKAKGIIRETRDAQSKMANLIERILNDKGVGLIEAPVGTGKTFAYMLPSMISKASRIVIATAKKSLQDQIALKDGPYLKTALESHDKIVLRKGKSNYACRARVDKALGKKETKAKKAFVDWLDQAQYGELTEYPGQRPDFWPRVTAAECIGQACSKYSTCGFIRSKRQAAEARIIVTNHHLLAMDFMLGVNSLLGNYDVLIIDEVHQLEAAIRGAYTDEISHGAWTVVRMTTHHLGGKKLSLDGEMNTRWDAMYSRFKGMNGAIAPDPFGSDGVWFMSALEASQDEIKAWQRGWGYLPIKMPNRAEHIAEGGGTAQQEALAAVPSAEREWVEDSFRAIEAMENLHAALKRVKTPGENDVLYAETRPGVDTKLVIAPINLGHLAGPRFYSIPTVIATSGTMTIDSDFTDIKKRLGFDWMPKVEVPTVITNLTTGFPVEAEVRAVHELCLDSPFNFKKQAALYTPKHLPMPVSGVDVAGTDRARYLDALAKEVYGLLQDSRGNAFILFTATTDLNALDGRLRCMPNPLDLRFIVQGDNPGQALQIFRDTKRSVILGLKSFWEGVDVQGDKLRLVIIPKLPFPVPNDPVLQAKERVLRTYLLKTGMGESDITGHTFRTLQVPPMVTDIRQGAGRLIRSQTDRGICAILDPRIWTGSSKRLPLANQADYRGYGETVVKSLPFARTSDRNLVKLVLDDIHNRDPHK